MFLSTAPAFMAYFWKSWKFSPKQLFNQIWLSDFVFILWENNFTITFNPDNLCPLTSKRRSMQRWAVPRAAKHVCYRTRRMRLNNNVCNNTKAYLKDKKENLHVWTEKRFVCQNNCHLMLLSAKNAFITIKKGNSAHCTACNLHKKGNIKLNHRLWHQFAAIESWIHGSIKAIIPNSQYFATG